MNRVAESENFAQKIGPVAETLQDARHLLPAGFLAPLVVDRGYIAGRVSVFNDPDFGFGVSHGSQLPVSSGLYHGAIADKTILSDESPAAIRLGHSQHAKARSDGRPACA